MKIAIFTLSEDLHGYLVAEQLSLLGHQCHVVHTDSLAGTSWIKWYSESSGQTRLKDSCDNYFSPSELHSVWWRRVNAPQVNAADFGDLAAQKLVTGECREALLGCLLSSFRGRWFNDPRMEVAADNKLLQLQVAKKIGLEIPATLVSSDASAIKQFVHDCNGQAIVKVVKGIANFSVPTRCVTEPDIAKEKSLLACPAVWQEIVPGREHYRIHVFGRNVIAAKIVSDKLDWRPDLEVPISAFELPQEVSNLCQKLIKVLGLEMGIVDMKIGANGKPIFLELNPQGQFAFIEAITGIPLAKYMAECLSAD
ncbi:hypothetical protein [Gilvimarinus chinensis]|uniref:hypothetical protein n=1 Tax=Gilvimarinus chinensis TaxID=396005 RepID=UPI001B7F9BB4|nr:hypothetical protein [Gilvimarinus chinensis]